MCVSCLRSLRQRPLITPTVVFMPKEEVSSTYTIHEVELFQCPECESVFDAKKSLRLHLRTHSARKGPRHIPERPFPCLDCRKSFVRLSGLQTHTYKYHSAATLTVCNRTFVQDSHYQLHALRTHSGDKPYQCRVCGEAFQESTSLQLHRSSYGDNRVYRCGYCDKKLSERHTLWMHLNFRLSSLTQSAEHSHNRHHTAEDVIVIQDDPPHSNIISAEQPLLSARSRSPCTDVDVNTDTGDRCIELLPSPKPSVQSASSSQLYVAQPPSLLTHAYGNQRAEVAHLELSSYYREHETPTQASTSDSIEYQTAMDFRKPTLNSLPLSLPLLSRSSLSPQLLSHSTLSPRPIFCTSSAPREETDNRPPTLRINWDAPLGPSQVQAFQQQ